jgi:hypothetical protein
MSSNVAGSLESGRRTHPRLPSSSPPARASQPPLLTQAWASRTSEVRSTICQSPSSPSYHADAPEVMVHKPGKKEKEERVKERSMGALQHWVYVQRSLHRAGVLPEPRRQKLDAIGFSWHPDKDLRWERCLPWMCSCLKAARPLLPLFVAPSIGLPRLQI